MTVKELMEKLSHFDPNSQVGILGVQGMLLTLSCEYNGPISYTVQEKDVALIQKDLVDKNVVVFNIQRLK